MLKRDYTDIFGGAILIASGAAFSIFAMANYRLGTVQNMGPGMLPNAYGIILAFLGLLIIVPALSRKGERPEIKIWSPLFVLLGLSSFALITPWFGLLPGTIAVIVVSSFAELKVRPLELALLCVTLCLIVWLIFAVGLGLPIPMFRWPSRV